MGSRSKNLYFQTILAASVLAFSISIQPTHAQNPCAHQLSQALSKTHVFSPELLPKKGPPVLIGLLVETPEGKPLLITSQQISDGHAGLLAVARKETGQDVRKITWAGELLFKKEGKQFKIVAANETAGILAHSSDELGIPFELQKSGASVENLVIYLNEPKHQGLRSNTMRTEKFNPKSHVSHFDSNAPMYSDFRHKVGTLGIDIKVRALQLLKLTEAQSAEQATLLEYLSERSQRAISMITAIEQQRGLHFQELETLLPVLKRMQRKQVLAREEYEFAARNIESFFRKYEAPKQLFE